MRPAKKKRLTVTVDAAIVKVAQTAVRGGRAGSISGWVNEALSKYAEEERRFAAMAEAVAAYESEHGAFSEQELEAQRRADRRNAVSVRAKRPSKRGRAA